VAAAAGRPGTVPRAVIARKGFDMQRVIRGFVVAVSMAALVTVGHAQVPRVVAAARLVEAAAVAP
jgi:hypothetical protein